MCGGVDFVVVVVGGGDPGFGLPFRCAVTAADVVLTVCGEHDTTSERVEVLVREEVEG